MDWRFNRATKGYPASDFPYAILRGGDLADVDAAPSGNLWILEIRLAHPSEPFGAFYEDLLSA